MDWIILIAAAFGAGVLNTIAGGGTFLTFPALVFAGLPPVAANATSAVAVLPGYLSGTIGFARELRTIERALILRLTLWTLIGGVDWRGPFDGILKRGIFSNCAVFITGGDFDLCLCRAIADMGITERTRGHALWRNRIDHGVRLWGLFQWGVGHCLACPVFHVGHEQHSPNERFEKLVILCALCHFGSGICPWRVCPLARGDCHGHCRHHRRIRGRANCQGPAPIRRASDCDRGWIWHVCHFLCASVFVKLATHTQNYAKLA